MKKITLPNGLRILFSRTVGAKSCAMGIWVASGSRFEAAQRQGASHFIEHILFKGTEKLSAFDIAAEIDETGGTLNAYTSKEYTCYYVRCLPEHISRCFSILGEMLTSPLLREEDVKLEKGVILEEIAMYEDSPEDLCADLIYESVWRNSPLGRNILGTRESVSSLTPTLLREHMSEFYVPERMTVSFCGNFDEDSAAELCEHFFGSMKNTGNPLSASPVEYTRCAVCAARAFEQNQICIGLPGISADDDDRFACSLMSTILGGASSSRLFQRIREEMGLVYSIDAGNTPYLNAGLLTVSLGLSRQSEETAVLEALKIMSELGDSVTEQELVRAKNQTKASLIMGLESVSSVAARMGRCELLFNRIAPDEELIEGINSVSLGDISRVAHRLIDLSKLSICSVGKVRKNTFYEKLIKIS